MIKEENPDSEEEKEIRTFVEGFREGQLFEDFFYKHSAFQEKKNRAKEIISYYVHLWSDLTYISPKEILEDKFYTQILEDSISVHTLDENISDDPAVFNTNVSNELAYIYYGMLEKGISREMALLWIERVQKNGMNSSFIRKEESDEAFVKKLIALIEKM